MLEAEDSYHCESRQACIDEKRKSKLLTLEYESCNSNQIILTIINPQHRDNHDKDTPPKSQVNSQAKAPIGSQSGNILASLSKIARTSLLTKAGGTTT